MRRKIKEFFNNIKVIRVVIFILIIIILLFLIFIKFLPIVKNNDTYINGFNVPFYYNLDIIFLAATLTLFIINFKNKKKILNILTLVMMSLASLSYLISYLFIDIIRGFYILITILYLLNIGLIYYHYYN